MTGIRLAGLVVGFVGVAALVGLPGGGSSPIRAAAVVVSAAFYALAALYGGRTLGHIQPLLVATGSMVAATLVTTPFGIAQAPGHLPGWKVIGSMLALGVVGTAVAYIICFGLIAGAGASKAILVTYLVPPIAVAYGAVILGEQVRVSAIAGLALILGGVGLGREASGSRAAAPRSRILLREPRLRGQAVAARLIWALRTSSSRSPCEDVEPAPLMFMRAARRDAARPSCWSGASPPGARRAPCGAVPGLVLGTINAAIPSRSSPGVSRTSTPASPRSRTRPCRCSSFCSRRASARASGPAAPLAGILIGLAGVAFLAGAQPGASWRRRRHNRRRARVDLVRGGALYGQSRTGDLRAGARHRDDARRVDRAPPVRGRQAPPRCAGWKAIASILALGIARHGPRAIVLFRMLRLYGAARTTLVTYLMPAVALVYGTVLLGER